MSDIDPLTGLPKDLGVIETISKEKQVVRIRTVRRRYGKIMTLVDGFDSSVDVKSLAKTLKSKLACGGTLKDGVIELQGDHKIAAKKVLISLGYPEEGIDTK
tara:strand:- start:1402 stop:1707 length:306 start_codon:yes stop_codon:yes gene_type:complete